MSKTNNSAVENTNSSDVENKTTSDAKNKVIVPGRRRSQLAINAANIMNGSDTQIFPVLTNPIQQTTGIPLITLGWIVSVRSFLQTTCTPIWGYWSDHHSRVKILSFGCFVWGICTILVGASVSIIDMFVFRIITGFGLAAIVPTVSSMIGDYFAPRERGKAYGIIGLTAGLGSFFGAIFGIVITGNDITTYIYWRFCFYVLGILSIVIGLVNLLVAKEPARGLMDTGEMISGAPAGYQMRVKDFKTILKNRTFMLIVAQGILGSIPWTGIPFLLPWLQDIGFDFYSAGAAFFCIGIAGAVGAVLGGWVGDKCAKWSPNRGRIMAAQLSIGSGLPIITIIFFVIPMNTGSLILYAVFFSLLMMFATWGSYSTNNPIFSELFEPEIRASVFSVDSMFEGGLAAFGPLIVTYVATGFGYLNPQPDQILTAAQMLANAAPLAMGLWVSCFFPWLFGLIIFTLVYFTYPKDMERIRKKLAERAKNQAENQAEN
ncbi:MAG TPA: MFS transporter [Candidatus Lokiarchaeia archaeon]|nr:MFS transporter [Candidatus Lokiarchaeia archaeon]